MYWSNLLLSDQSKFKIQRHAFFWTGRLFFMFVYRGVNLFSFPDHKQTFFEWLRDPQRIRMLEVEPVQVLLEALFCYAGIYWLMPKYLMKGRYLSFAFGLTLTSFLYNAVFHLYLYWIFFPLGIYGGFDQVTYAISKNFLTWIGLPTLLLLMAYKMLKKWYQNEKEATALIEENTGAELSLLKAQVHPHFLFNTLNNIYSFTLNKSPRAGELVGKLLHIIKYMTHECNEALVPLSKEIKILNDYIGLEKIRYGNRLDLEMDIAGEAHGKFIAPLLMIPFVENSFKHGASRILENPWIKLTIRIEDERILFAIQNSKPPSPVSASTKGGLGLKNVKRRLEILYPGAHQLRIMPGDHDFRVEMLVGLEKVKAMPEQKEKEFQGTVTH
ncbi:MAG: histidine kinase [Bacteroidetes bacterium]|nr:histidine kinase [Bacteroidota bacterium]